jgi:hypothetical protein
MRPAMHPLTASTLRRAHALAERRHRATVGTPPLPEGVTWEAIAMLARDYHAWRCRVARGAQPDTPPW